MYKMVYRYEKKRVLIKAGHKGEFVYYIYNGTVSVTIEHVVDDITTATLKPGAIFGVSYYHCPSLSSCLCF